jgi:lipid-A-disaccharide synthase
MKPRSFMVVAGEASGDQLAAELVQSLRAQSGRNLLPTTRDPQPLRADLEPRFFGAGGRQMRDAGVELAIDLTQSTVFGITGVLKHYFKFLRYRNQLLQVAVQRQPDVLVGVDYSGFNRSLAAAVCRHVRRQSKAFGNWRPKIVQFVSPQVWASRESRVYQLQRDYNLILSIFPFEKPWYAEHAPRVRVEFVGHFLVDRCPDAPALRESKPLTPATPARVLLLPGSRKGELARHIPVVVEAARRILAKRKAVFTLVLPSEELRDTFTGIINQPGLHIDTQIGRLPEALATADLAIASSGTVTLECAWFGVPTVVLYRLSRFEYEIGRRIVKVPYIAMPNLLAGEAVFPEFIQNEATPEHLAAAALRFLEDDALRAQTCNQINRAVATLGQPGACQRAAEAVLSLLDGPTGTRE